MSTHPLAVYLADCRARRSTGAVTPETSLYAPLENLLKSVGAKLKPRVHCFMSLKNQGGNMPDGGLFTHDQLARGSHEPPDGQAPARGVIECKPPKDDAWVTAETEQVTRYWQKYNQVLVTNYRDFVLISSDGTGKPVVRETYRLADSERHFWDLNAEKLVKDRGDQFVDFLTRVLLHPAPIADPKDVAWFLASYARDAKTRIERATGVKALSSIRNALEQALGVSFHDPKDPEKGARFFRSTLVQTLFYGVFSAWVLWHRSTRKGDRFDWEKSARYLRVPVLRKLFHELADPGKLQEWKLDEPLGWAGDVLNRVDRSAFFGKFHDSHAVQYFYEPFLEEFDPDLRKQLGVWYTPPEIVKYMVARVDQVLKNDLGRPDGLADESVFVLDPCCGTGAYLVEVLHHVDAALKESGADATRAAKLKQAALSRVFGFELLPAPFVVAHLQLGIAMQDAGAPLDDKKQERARVYLTNALTGWEPPKEPQVKFLFAEFEEEHDQADAIKQKKPILVVLGNPPYNGYAGVAVNEERSLSDAYRWKPGDPPELKPQGQGLNDLYVRFYRMAERCIVSGQNGEGVVCFISNFSWLDALSFPLMRDRFLKEFDNIWIDSLNGDKYRTGKLTPNGDPDPSAFSTDRNREGIQVGTAIATLIRAKAHKTPADVHYRDFWGTKKLAELAAFGEAWTAAAYDRVTPLPELGLPFRNLVSEARFSSWPTIADIFASYFTGIKTSRDDVVVDIDSDSLIERMTAYFDPTISHDEMRRISPKAVSDAAQFNAIATREVLWRKGFRRENVIPFAYRPFDNRWLYWESETKLLDRNRAEYIPHLFAGNLWLSVVQQNRKEYDPPQTHSRAVSIHIIERSANVFPLFLRKTTTGDLLDSDSHSIRNRLGEHLVNLTDAAIDYLQDRGGLAAAPDLFLHTIAVLHSPLYASENSDALRQDWPRVPLPANATLLRTSAELGRQVAALLEAEKAVDGVTRGRLRAELKGIGVPTRVGGGQFDPSAGDLDVTARWGISGKGGICMPSTGKTVERSYTDSEHAALGESGVAALGETTFDVYLNDNSHWKNVPSRVWNFSLGGYQVIKKWLSYREKSLLGRALNLAEIDHIRDVARRIAALCLFGPALNANYEAAKADSFLWNSEKSTGSSVAG